MSQNITEGLINPIRIQGGNGVPNHISTIGSFYVDKTTGDAYLNKNGLAHWAGVLDSDNTITGSSSTLPYKLITSAYTISNSDYYIEASAVTSASTYSVVLPTAVGIVGRSFVIKNSGVGIITITTTSSQFIDNLPSYTLAFYDTLTVESNGANWLIAQPQTKSFIRVYNNSGSIITKGSACKIQASSDTIPTISLANAANLGNQQVAGLAFIDIPNNAEGLLISSGILAGLNLSGFTIGDILYLSDTVDGGYVASTSSLAFSSRSNQIGYVTTNNPTVGTLQVSIRNEDINLSLTDIQRNILEGNVISTGALAFSGITLASNSTFNVGAAEAWLVDNTTKPLSPSVIYVRYSGQTNVPSLYYTSATETYLLITSAATLVQQTTFPTPQQRRENIYLGKIGHGNRTSLINAFNEPDFDVSPISQLRDMFTPIKLINENVYPSAHTGLTFNTSSGTLWGLGVGFVTNQLNPNSIAITANTPTTFQYRTQTGGTASNTTIINPANYDLNGVITAVGLPAKQATNQRIFMLQNGQFRLQYGQIVYADLATAIAAVTTEPFTVFSNFRDNAILIAVLSIRSDATLLSDIAQAKITYASKFGESVGGTGGISTTTLQQAYDNSSTPEILINSTLDGLTIQNGTGNADLITHLLEGQNTAGSVTSFITAAGGFSGSSVSAVTITTASVTANSNGLSATTISATTYHNLPTDIRVTGGTYSNGSAIFTNNTGGTFSVSGFNTGSTSANLWSAGTGTGSVIQNNGTGNIAAGMFSLSVGLSTSAMTQFAYAEGNSTYASSTGDTAHAEGSSTRATGTNSHAEGYLTTASGNEAHSEGFNTTSSGHFSHAEGSYTKSTNDSTHSEGTYTTASGEYSHAEGRYTVASGSRSHAEGNQTEATGIISHAEGAQTTASNTYSHSEGALTTASGIASHAQGYGSIASSNYSHAEGNSTRASSESAHAEGESTTASGIGSHAEGRSTTSLGDYSHAGGRSSISSGQYSFVHGTGSTASGLGSVVLGNNITGTSSNTTYTNTLIASTISATTYQNLPSASVSYNAYFGSGSDGDVTITGNTAISKHMYYNNLTINSGATLYTSDLQIFAKTSITNNGTISSKGQGSNGGNATGVTAGSAGTYTSTGYATISMGNNGAAGAGGTNGVGASGSINFGGFSIFGGAGATGGNGGSGGAGAGGTQATNGTTFIYQLQTIATVFTGGINGSQGGSGGASGAGNASSNFGGAGGGGGSSTGAIYLASPTIINSGVINASGFNGGNGGNATGAGNCGGGGGGAGGGGGFVYLLYNNLTAGTITVSGGTGGTGGAKLGTGLSGSTGGTGSSGKIVQVNLTTQTVTIL